MICVEIFSKAGSVDEAVFYWSFLSGMASGSISALAVNPFDVGNFLIKIFNPIVRKM